MGVWQRIKNITGQSTHIDASFVFQSEDVDGEQHEIDQVEVMDMVLESPALRRALEYRNGSKAWLFFLQISWYNWSGYVFVLAMVFYLYAAYEW